MSVLLVGSIGIDDIITPYASAEKVLGGSGSYASFAISLFTQAKLIGVVGTDFKEKYLPLFKKENIDIKGLKIKEGKTFYWKGEYKENFNERVTHITELNVFADFDPEVPDEYKNEKYIFLANIDPDLQIKVLKNLNNPRFVLLDTMKLWIDTKFDELIKAFKMVNAVIINDEEARLIFKTKNLYKAARELVKLGPEWAIIKKGEHGVILYSKKGELFLLPAYPVEDVIDPTGAGDSFAGAMIGYIAKENEINFSILKKSIVWGTVVASFTIQDFSVNKLIKITKEDLEKRYNNFLEYIKI